MTTRTIDSETISTLAEFAASVPGDVLRNDRGNGSCGPMWLGDSIDSDAAGEPVTVVTEAEDVGAWKLAREALAAMGLAENEPVLVAVGKRSATGYQAIYVG